MKRASVGKCIALSARDIEIFRQLARYHYLPSTYLQAFAGGVSVTRFKERLGDLFHEGFIDRPSQQWNYANCRSSPAIYEGNARSRHFLLERGIQNDDQATWLGRRPHRQFLHSRNICEMLASIELTARARSNLRFVAWSEILSRAPKATRESAEPYRLSAAADGRTPSSHLCVIPDAVFGIEYGQEGRKSYRFFAVEIDRGTMPVERSCPNQTSYLAKMKAYAEIILHNSYRTWLGTPNLLVLTITTDMRRMERMIAAIHNADSALSAAFLFKAVPSLASGTSVMPPRSATLEQPWLRPGHPPVDIFSAR